MHVLIAPNAFKNSLTAQDAAKAIQDGLNLSTLKGTSACFPIADGGDGTGSLIIEQMKGIRVETEVHDPLGRLITSSFGLIDQGKTAVIEMADASGLRLLNVNELDPTKASSIGTGELIKAALDKGADKIIIAMGGSATVDGGCGILSALGFRFFDSAHHELEAIPQNLAQVETVDHSEVNAKVLNCEIIILCDVDNLLLGPNGSAAVFGPQKGADAETVLLLDQFLDRLSQIAKRQYGTDMASVKYGGAAGGAAAGLYAFLNASLVNGIDYFLDLTGFDEALSKADVLITGEGSIDSQTLQGKGPFGVASRAVKNNVPIIGLAGKVPLEPEADLLTYFNTLLAIGNGPDDLSGAMKNTKKNLIRMGTSIGNMLSFK